MKKKIIIHIGYPKTGSAYLKNFFASLNNINYLNETETKFINELMFFINSLSKNSMKKKRNYFLNVIKRIKFKNINVISWENLSACFLGNYYSPEFKIKYLGKIFDNRKYDISFLLLTREINSHLRSIYLQFNYNLLFFNKKNYSMKYFCNLKFKKKNDEIIKNLSHINLKTNILKIFTNSKFYIFNMNDLLIYKKNTKKFSKIFNIKSQLTNNYFSHRKPQNVSSKKDGKWVVKNNFFRKILNTRRYIINLDKELILILIKKAKLYLVWFFLLKIK